MIVAYLFRCFDHRFGIFWCHRGCYQLDEYWILIRIYSSKPVSLRSTLRSRSSPHPIFKLTTLSIKRCDVDAQQGRNKNSYHNHRDPDPAWQLGPICGDQSRRRALWRRHVWADLDRIRAAVLPLCSDKVQRSVVQRSGTDQCDCLCKFGEPAWGSPGSIDRAAFGDQGR